MRTMRLLPVIAAWCWLLAFGGPAVAWWGLCAVLAVMMVRQSVRLARNRGALPAGAGSPQWAFTIGGQVVEVTEDSSGRQVYARRCAHQAAVEVVTRDWDPNADHQRVAWWCDECKTQLPPDWTLPGPGAAYVNVEGLTARRRAELLAAVRRGGEPVVIDGNLDVRPEPSAAVWVTAAWSSTPAPRPPPVGESREQIEAAGYEAVEVPEFGFPGPGPFVRGRRLRPPNPNEAAERPITGPSGWVHDDQFPGGAWVLENAAGDVLGAITDNMLGARLGPLARESLAAAAMARYGSVPPPLRGL